MGKRLRIKCLLIALIFLMITAAGIAAGFVLGDTITATAMMYGAGTEQDPYRLYTSGQLSSLQEISQGIQNAKYTDGKYFRLCSDVDLTASCARYSNESECSFYGIFDGDGHTVNAGGNLMFFRIASGAQVKNLNIKIDMKPTIRIYNEDSDAHCGLAVVLSEGGVIENCTVTGDITIKGYQYGQYAGDTAVSGICNYNNGTIRNCTYNGNITGAAGEMQRYLALRDVSGIAAFGSGAVENCTFNGSIDLIVNAMHERIAGISFRNTVKNCTFNGNVNLRRYTGVKDAAYLGLKVSVYGIAENCENGIFNGDVLSSHSREPSVFKIAGDGSTFEHNGVVSHTP